MDVDSSAIVMRDLDGDGVQDPVALVWYQEKGYTGLNGRLAIKHNGDNQTGVRVILSWYCCCDHCLSSSFTDFCRGAAVAITAFHHLSPTFVVVLLLRSLPLPLRSAARPVLPADKAPAGARQGVARTGGVFGEVVAAGAFCVC